MEHFEHPNKKKGSLVVWMSAKFYTQCLNGKCYNLGQLVCLKCYSTVHYYNLEYNELT